VAIRISCTTHVGDARLRQRTEHIDERFEDTEHRLEENEENAERLSEMDERLDFTERMLTKHNAKSRLEP
jgi:hypothetical protein